MGDYINLTYTFTNTASLLAGGTNSYIVSGLYNSGGVPPVAGGLNNSGLTGIHLPEWELRGLAGVHSACFQWRLFRNL